MLDSQDSAKRAAAGAAVELVEPGMRLGLGTGSTAEHFIRLLAERVAGGLEVRAVATSERSAGLAARLLIPLADLHELPALDLAVDGADEIDPALNLIKGGGGALLREKIVAAAARRFVVVADRSKCVSVLGSFALPVEVVGFAVGPLLGRLGALAGPARLRRLADGRPFVTDEGHQLLDCACGAIANPARLACELAALPGVVEHGLFVGMAAEALIGDADGRVERRLPR
ncbi:MAG: ribose-5-phosphate isomerase RpiA [Alphaproteobacteria bacterium]|nr:ribose-5-phosphate isomerase RpiA [Alphaproteobacteria bacterium]